jgi:nickel-dependent lactate racemase
LQDRVWSVVFLQGIRMSVVEVPVGAGSWSFEVADDCLRTVRPELLPGEPIGDLRSAVRQALDRPLRLDFPLSRAMTPDDRIALVVDEQLPQLGHLVTGVLEYLAVAGIGPDAVTILTIPGATSSDWINDLPDEFADVHTEAHQPGDRKLLSYLATTKRGRRVYLNRTLVDADQIISLSTRRFDPLLGYAGAEGGLYPALSDTDARVGSAEWLSIEVPSPDNPGLRAEAAEVAWLLGAPIFIHAIEARDDGIAYVGAGLTNTCGDTISLLEKRWRFTVPDAVDVVLAGIGGRSDMASFARAALAASRVVKPDGVVVLLSEAEPVLGEGMELLRQCEDTGKALRMLADKKPLDRPVVFQWVSAASHARIYLASGLRPELVEEIVATPILSPNEVQRLLELGGSCLVLPDADKSLVVIE